MPTSLSPQQNLLFQSYFTVSLLGELSNNDLLNSDYFEGMTFGAPWIKEELGKIGVDNQGSAMMALYAMLVIPRETIHQTYSSDYDKIDAFLGKHTRNTTTTYLSDANSVRYLRHIRNAVAHARVEFRPSDAVIFEDEDNRTSETFSMELPLNYFGEFLNQLQMVHIAYIRDLQQSIGRGG